MKLGILGSCVSRDILAHDDGSIDLKFYLARSSLGSMFAQQPFPDGFSARLTSSFQQRMVKADITKSCEALLREADVDLILLDLIDERFDLFEVPDGGRCTLSTEMVATKFREEVEGVRIRSGLHSFIVRWREGWERLVAILESRDLLSRLVINKVFWQAASDDGEAFDKTAVQAANTTLKSMYGTMRKTLSPDQFIEYGSTLSAPASHKWGRSPFHYSDENMRLTLEKLKSYHQNVARDFDASLTSAPCHAGELRVHKNG